VSFVVKVSLCVSKPALSEPLRVERVSFVVNGFGAYVALAKRSLSAFISGKVLPFNFGDFWQFWHFWQSA
jgi:hypothetical protein